MLPTSRHDQSANAAFAFGKTARGTYSTTLSYRARLAKLGLFLFVPLSLHHMMTDETTRVHRYRSPDCATRDTAGALQGSRCRSFGYRTQNVYPIRQFRVLQELFGRQGNREDVHRQHFHLCVSSSIVPFDAWLIDFRFSDVNSRFGRWCHRSCRRRVSHGGREDSAAGTDALPCRSSGDSPVPKRWTRRVQDYSRGGFQSFIPRSFPDGSQASYEPRWRGFQMLL